MASANAGPITGSELIAAIQDTRTVLLTRPQVASLLAFTALTSPRPLSRLNARTGQEAFVLVQGGARVEFSSADFTTWLAGTASPETVPANRLPNDFTGRERLMLRQGTGSVGVDLDQVAYVRGLGGSLDGVSGDTGGTPTPSPTPTLGALSLSGTLTNGTTSTGTITGATSGSSIASNVTGLSVNSAARTYSFDGSAIAGTTANGLVETLAGATNSPRSSAVVVAAAGQSIITPANWDFVNYGDSRGENAFPNAAYTSAAGYTANSATTGPAAWFQQESGNRLRPALYPNFGMSATTTTQGAANPRVSVHGDNATVSLARNQTVPSEWWRGGTSRAAPANQETNCGPFNKGPEAVATSGAGVMFLLYGTNDQNGDLASLSRDNILAILNRAGGSVLKVILNETSKGVRTDGTLNYTMQANMPAYADWLKTLSFDSGSANARNDVIVVDTFTPTYDAANTRIKQGYLRDGLHFSPWGAREIAKLVHARLAAVYGAAYTGVAPRVVLPVSNGASIAADQIGVAHGGFIHTNPLMTQGTGGALQGTNWAVAPATSGIPQGWTVSGTGTGAGITIVAERSLDPDGYPQVTLTFSGTLVDSATYTFSLYQTAQQSGQFTINDKLRSFGRFIVAAGSQQFQGVKLRSYLFSATAGLAQQIVDMNNSAGAPADRIGYLINSNGYDAGGYDTIMATQLADVQNPNMAVGSSGFGTATAVGNFSQVGVWADMVFSNYTGATLPISAVIKISRMGMTKVSG